jgi:quercetin dioxygenase-like cupin family protein
MVGYTSPLFMDVERWDRVRDGAPSEAELRRRLEARGYRVWRYDYPPGTVFALHTHDVDKIDAVVSGRFRITIGRDASVLEAGDCVAVPRGVAHRAEVVGEELVVSLDAVKD